MAMAKYYKIKVITLVFNGTKHCVKQLKEHYNLSEKVNHFFWLLIYKLRLLLLKLKFFQ
jgi:hypothetical protein